jgi:hypothetical protein
MELVAGVLVRVAHKDQGREEHHGHKARAEDTGEMSCVPASLWGTYGVAQRSCPP